MLGSPESPTSPSGSCSFTTGLCGRWDDNLEKELTIYGTGGERGGVSGRVSLKRWVGKGLLAVFRVVEEGFRVSHMLNK